MKKLLAFLLSVLFIISAMPISTLALIDEFEYTYVVENGEATITGATGPFPSHLAIPSTINTIPVTAIGNYAFRRNNIITSVSIPGSINTINNDAFGDCTNLSSVTLGNGVKFMEQTAFYGCTSLTSLTLPNTMVDIANSTFNGCTNLSKITLPDKRFNIGQYAFKNTAYYNNEANWEDGVLYIGKHLIDSNSTIASDYKVKEGTLTIADNALDSCGLTQLTIPGSVLQIGEYAIYNNTILKSVTLNEGLKYIDYGAFSRCWELSSVTIPDSVLTIGSSAFSQCEKLFTVKIGDGVTEIGSSAFYGCYKLSNLHLGKSVKTIGLSAFLKKFSSQFPTIVYGVSNLYITDLEAYCKIRTSYDTSTMKPVPPQGLAEKIYLNGELLIPDGITKIYNHTFRDCSSITSVTLPESVTSVEKNAFYNCDNLKTVNMPNGTIGDNAFGYCFDLYNVTLGKGVTSIGSNAFYNCTYLAHITMPDSITSISDTAFENCTFTEESGFDPFDIVEPIEPLKIYTSKNSTAYTYANDNEIYYKISGDFTEDEEIKAEDMIALKKVILQGDGKVNADLNYDGKINILDLISMKKVLAE